MEQHDRPKTTAPLNQTAQMLQTRRIPLMNPVLDQEMIEAALQALQNEKFVMGESVHKFEEEFARYCGTRYAISTGSGTAALQIALQSLGVAQGDSVLTTPFSFIATSNSIIHAGATPEFSDADPTDFNLSAHAAEMGMTERTKAIMPVHLYGRPCRMDEFQELAQRKGVRLIEDACQAHGAEYMGKRIGSFGDAACFSFYPSKNMTVGGDGGMITTNDEHVAEAARGLTDCGRDGKSKYEMSRIGYTSRLNSSNAAIGRIQLKRLDGWNLARRRIAALYRRELENVDKIELPVEDKPESRSVYHLFVIRTPIRDLIKSKLASSGIETGVHYPIPIHLQAPYRRIYGYSEGAFPTSELLAREVLSLPLHANMKEEEVKIVCERVREAVTN